MQDVELFLCEGLNCLFCDSQADFGSFCEDGGVRAGDVEQDAIKEAFFICNFLQFVVFEYGNAF